MNEPNYLKNSYAIHVHVLFLHYILYGYVPNRSHMQLYGHHKLLPARFYQSYRLA